jgi:hypothetical protein
MSEPTAWHRLFGLSLVDFFRGMPVVVELEKDLSLKQQLVDVVLIRKEPGPLPCRLPDGFEELAAHNLISFKSYQEALDGWALNELIGHYVNYRKQASPSMQDLLPETDFHLFAVSVRFPQGLARAGVLTPVKPGVYEARHFTGTVRILAVHELPQEEHNALLHLFSARAELLRYGAGHYRPHSEETSKLLLKLFARYRVEGAIMPDSLEMLKQFAEETKKEVLHEASVEERLEGLPPEELVKRLSPDQLFAALSPEQRAALAQRLKDYDSSANPESKESGPGNGKQ